MLFVSTPTAASHVRRQAGSELVPLREAAIPAVAPAAAEMNALRVCNASSAPCLRKEASMLIVRFWGPENS